MKELTVNSVTRLAPSGCRYVDVANMPWQEPFPGIRMKILYKDNTAKETAILFDTQPGTVIPDHIHGGVEWTFVLEGTMEDDDGVVTPGNFVYRPPGSRHSVRTPNGAKYLTLFHEPGRMVATDTVFPDYHE